MQKTLAHGAFNCMVVPYNDPQGWFFEQFPTKELLEQYAADNHLVMKMQS